MVESAKRRAMQQGCQDPAGTAGSQKRRLNAVEAAARALGSPETLWFRGHVEEHQLLPSLFWFPGGVARERLIIDRYRRKAARVATRSGRDDLAMLVAMHHSYVPTRLLAWTGCLYVAVFCALARQSSRPSLFVLDPLALNARSGIAGIVRPTHDAPSSHRFPARFDSRELPTHPVAIDARPLRHKPYGSETMFTLHGKSKMPLEQQCPGCVRRVVLAGEQKSLAEDWVLRQGGGR